MSKRIWCPGCSQGWVVPVKVPALNRDIFVCEECDTTWFSRAGIGTEKPVNFVTFMRENGLKGLWTEVVEDDD